LPRNLYKCEDSPVHASLFIDKYDYDRNKMNADWGGVVMIEPDDFIKVNGYSNLFWGWGKEDGDMATSRVAKKRAFLIVYVSGKRKCNRENLRNENGNGRAKNQVKKISKYDHRFWFGKDKRRYGTRFQRLWER